MLVKATVKRGGEDVTLTAEINFGESLEEMTQILEADDVFELAMRQIKIMAQGKMRQYATDIDKESGEYTHEVGSVSSEMAGWHPEIRKAKSEADKLRETMEKLGIGEEAIEAALAELS